MEGYFFIYKYWILKFLLSVVSSFLFPDISTQALIIYQNFSYIRVGL